MIKILHAEPADAEHIIHLQHLAYQSEAVIYNDWSLPPLTQTIESLLAELENTVILKALKNDEIVGSVRAAFSDGICRIGRLIVSPKCQRQGIGSQLLSQIEKMHSKAEVFELFTGDKSVGNIRLYERHGYSICRTQVLSERVSITFLIKKNVGL